MSGKYVVVSSQNALASNSPVSLTKRNGKRYDVVATGKYADIVQLAEDLNAAGARNEATRVVMEGSVK